MKAMHEKSLGMAWIKLMKVVMEEGMEILDDDQRLKEIRNVCLTIDSVNENDAILDIYADKERIKLMKEKYATCGLVGEYTIDYGSRIHNNDGVDQLLWVGNRIRNKRETKSATISLHKPGEEKLPCLSLLDFKLRNGRNTMTAVYRSQNAYWSMPGNILALRKIQEEVSTDIDAEMDAIELVVVSSHIYEKDYKKVNEIINDFIVNSNALV